MKIRQRMYCYTGQSLWLELSVMVEMRVEDGRIDLSRGVAVFVFVRSRLHATEKDVLVICEALLNSRQKKDHRAHKMLNWFFKARIRSYSMQDR